MAAVNWKRGAGAHGLEGLAAEFEIDEFDGARGGVGHLHRTDDAGVREERTVEAGGFWW